MSDQTNADTPGWIRCIGIMLIVLGVVRLGLLANTLIVVPHTAFENSTFLFTSIVLPATLGTATLAAGILVVQGIAVAKAFGLAVCGFSLAAALYGLASVLMLMRSRPGMTLSPVFWILNPTTIVLYTIGIVGLSRWHPQPPPSS